MMACDELVESWLTGISNTDSPIITHYNSSLVNLQPTCRLIPKLAWEKTVFITA